MISHFYQFMKLSRMEFIFHSLSTIEKYLVPPVPGIEIDLRKTVLTC